MKVLSAAVAVALAAAGVQATEWTEELTCLGRVAHRQRIEVDDAGKPVSILVSPALDENARCIEERLLEGIGKDHPLCIGANEDATCQKAKEPELPLPLGAKCEGCFLGLATDLFYTLNITGLRLEHASVGFRGSQLHSTLAVSDSIGKGGAHSGSKTFLTRPLQWQIKRFGKVLLELRLSMPVEVHYELKSKDSAHADAGVALTVDFGQTSAEFQRGEGWHVHHDKPTVALKPMVAGDFTGEAWLRVGATNSVRFEVVDFLWFQSNFTLDVPMTLTSVGSAGSHDVHSCVDGGYGYALSHEADAQLPLFRQKLLHRHWGPKVDRAVSKPDVLHHCVDRHPPASSSSELVV